MDDHSAKSQDSRRASESDIEKQTHSNLSGLTSDGASDLGSDQKCSAAPPPPPSKPDGGLRAWLQVLAGFMCYLNSWGMVTAFGVFQIYYKDTYLPEYSNSSISWIGTIQGFLLAFTSIFAGAYLDRGHPHTLVAFGGFLVVLGLMMTSICQQVFWQLFLAQGVCVGIGAGCLFIVAVGVLPGWFDRHLALATGISAAGSSLGGIIYPIIFHRLVEPLGFGCTVRIMGFTVLGTTAIALACTKQRSRRPPQPRILDITGFKEPLFVIFSAVSFIGAAGLYIPFFYLEEYASVNANISAELAFYMLPILSAGSILGRILPAFFADKLGFLKVLTCTTLISSIIAFCWLGLTSSSTGGVIVWALFYGAFSGTFVSLQTPTVASITPDLRMVGGRIGMSSFCLALGVLIGNPVAGVLHESDGWVGLQAFCGACLFVAAALTGVTLVLKLRYNAKHKRENDGEAES
nr:aspyridones efflux protein apdF-like [Quercus suber]POF15547.1 aspyridones efflux protein apdf [Quercus suber]